MVMAACPLVPPGMVRETQERSSGLHIGFNDTPSHTSLGFGNNF